MKLFLPKQHGAWAMIIIPFWLGVINGGFIWKDIPFFIGWILLYLTTYPMLLMLKGKKIAFYAKWTTIYIIPSLVVLLIVLFERPSLIYFGFVMIPFFIINAYYTAKSQDRALLNDFSAIFAFSIVGIASSYLSLGFVNAQSILLFIMCILFFIGCTFYVKTMIREKKNTKYKWLSWSYHFLLLVIWALLGNWIVLAAYLPSLLRAIYFYGKKLSPKQIGVYEIINSAIFFLILAIQILIK